MRNINRLNEEIARWAFEILFKTNTDWTIAFTNPTAGPWKIIKANALDTGVEGEVYRFGLKETRPDIIMYSDELEITIIFEAKDNIKKLAVENQAIKSAKVVVDLAKILHEGGRESGPESGPSPFWRGRESYKVILGLLWGSTDVPETDIEKNSLYDFYHNLIQNKDNVFCDLVIGIETLYQSPNLNCTAFYKDYNGQFEDLGKKITESLIK